jgi:hypothetical protein
MQLFQVGRASCVLLRLYYGSIKALLRLYEGSIKGLGSIKAQSRLY